MERIGQFIGLCTNKAGVGVINCFVEILKAYPGKLLWIGVLKLSINRRPKFKTAAKIIFIKTGLGFVHSHGGTAAYNGHCDSIVNALFVKPMSCLVNDGEHCGVNLVF